MRCGASLLGHSAAKLSWICSKANPPFWVTIKTLAPLLDAIEEVATVT